MMCILKGRMDKGGHYDVQRQCMDKERHKWKVDVTCGNYDVQIKKDEGKERHYDAQIKGWVHKGAL